MKLKAPIDKVLGVDVERESKTEAGIIMVDHPSGPISEIYVKLIDVGEDVKGYSVGDVVVTNPYSGKVFFVDRKAYRTLHPHELYATILE